MQKLTLVKWRPIPPSMLFGDEIPALAIEWPDYSARPECIDPLTGVPNRRAFDEASEMVMDQGVSFGLIVLDIDHFKKVNDTYGHQAGDKALQIFTAVVKSTLRDQDFCARIGGEEFAVITSTSEKVFDIGERIRSAVEHSIFNVKKDVQITVTSSFGCASYPKDAYSFDKLFELADRLLYEAKKEGRNRGKVNG